jgi:hypothetical protein
MPFYKAFKGIKFDKKKLWIGAIFSFLALWFLLAFWRDIDNVLQLIRLGIGLPNRLDNQGQAERDLAIMSLWILLFNLVFSFIPVFLAWLFLISGQALLPISNVREIVANKSTWSKHFNTIYRTAFHLLLYMTRQHGPAVFIKDGKELSTAKEKKRTEPGVIVIDFNSAIVLEQLLPPISLLLPFIKIVRGILELLGLSDPLPASKGKATIPQRAAGPGIVFTRSYERIRGVIDLRKQSRFRPKVAAYTRDGIELQTNGIWVLFSAGQDPKILKITHIGGRQAENLQAISIKILDNGKVQVAKLSKDELDPEDRLSIQKTVGEAKANRLPFRVVLSPEKGTGKLKDIDEEEPAALPKFNKERVFAAISSNALDAEGGKTWDSLPAQIGVDIFREVISNVNYDKLYNPDQENQDDFPLTKVREKFDLAVRNTGLLSFRLLFHRNGSLISEGIYDPDDLVVSKVTPLPITRKTVLRERGLKIIASGFLELKPVSQVVYQQRLETWRSKWDREREETHAVHELDAMRIRSHARAQAQRELTHVLLQLLNNADYTKEALALRLLQALETAATDPSTHRLLPADTINLIRGAHEWLTVKEPDILTKLPPLKVEPDTGMKRPELPPGSPFYDGTVKPQDKSF